MAGPHGLREYKRSRERQQTTGTGGGVSGAAITNTLSPQLVREVELDDTVMQVRVERAKGEGLKKGGDTRNPGAGVEARCS